MSEKKTSWIKYAVFAATIFAVYFIYVEVQTRLGQSVLDDMQLERHTLSDAFIKASTENKLVLANLSAIWCPTCRNLDKNVFSNPAVQTKINEKYIFARVEFESEDGEAFMETYDVSRFPTLLILKPNGEKVKQLKATTQPGAFVQLL